MNQLIKDLFREACVKFYTHKTTYNLGLMHGIFNTAIALQIPASELLRIQNECERDVIPAEPEPDMPEDVKQLAADKTNSRTASS